MSERASNPLDRADVVARTDALDMLGAIAGLPRQLTEAWRRTRDLVPAGASRSVTNVAVLGMGGSAIGSDIVRGVFADRLRVPLVTVREFVAPAFVGPTSLVVASSHSGATAETLAALETAARRGCAIAAIASGGPLLAAARGGGLPVVEIPRDGQPRAAIGWSVITLAGLLERAGVLNLTGEEVEAAAGAAAAMVRRCGPGVATESNPAKQLAWSLVDRFPVIVAGGFLGPVARRWKTQLNENGKTSAAFDEIPEALHNSIAGLAEPDSARDRLYVVFLASSGADPRLTRRMTLVGELLDQHGIAHEVATTDGSGPLSEAFASIVLGDFVSAYLGLLYGQDPTPIPEIVWVKERLASEERTTHDE